MYSTTAPRLDRIPPKRESILSAKSLFTVIPKRPVFRDCKITSRFTSLEYDYSVSHSGSVPSSWRFSQLAFLLTQICFTARAGTSLSTSPAGIGTVGSPKTEGRGEPQSLQKDLRYAGGSRSIGASQNEISSSPRSQRNLSARTRNCAANGEPVAR